MSTPLNDAVVASGAKRSSEPSEVPDMRLRGHWLILARVVWVILAVLTLGLIIASIPSFFAFLHVICTGALETCRNNGQLTPDDLRTFQTFGLSLDFFAAYWVVVYIVIAVGFATISALIFWRKSDDRMALFASLTLILLTADTNFSELVTLPSPWALPGQFVAFLGISCFFLFLYLFPSGRFVPRWTRWLWVGASMLCAVKIFFPSLSFNSSLLFVVLLLGFFSSPLGAQIYRYRRVSNAMQQQQTKWVVYGIATTIGSLLVVLLFLKFLPSLIEGLFVNLIFITAGNLALLLFPLSISVAILRYRLWDIDIIIRRTLLYGMLTACVVTLYVLVVFGLGALLQTKGNLGLSLLTTGLVAVLIQPLHTRLQRAVNRLLYGERDEPYKVISRLGQRLEATLAPEAVLPTIVETVTGALKLPYAAISLKHDGEDVIAASSGQASDELTRLPLVYQGEHIGDLLLTPRARGETFSSADQALLADLARQAGIAIHAVRLTTDLQRLTKELQLSRTDLVTAREEERRRLRRDLHDGLGSVLASLNWRAGALRMVLFRDPVAADALVVEQQTTIQAAIGDIRRLVYDLRPPALDELGLLGAIRERAAKQSTPAERDNALGLRVEVVAPDHLPALPAAIEVVAYRIVQEALTNVVRHAQAHWCCIRLSCEDDLLHIEVSDDGIGLPESYRAGVGVLSMRERAAELGGTCEITPLPGGRTCVHACLPSRMQDQER